MHLLWATKKVTYFGGLKSHNGNPCGCRYSKIWKASFLSQKRALMAIRSIDVPFFLPNQIFPLSKCKASPLAFGHGRCFGAGMVRRNQLLIKAKVSAEREHLVGAASSASSTEDVGIIGIHHVGILCENLEKSLEFYQNLLGLKINEARPNDKLPYRGVWLWVGDEMIHLMELPNPDPLIGRPEHGGRDRHSCITIENVSKLKEKFDQAGIKYTLSKSGRPAIFARDPDGNALEFAQIS